jgi:hypothetical protein
LDTKQLVKIKCRKNVVGFEVLTAVPMKSVVFWVGTLFGEGIVFGKNIPPPSSWSKSKPKQETGRIRHTAWFLTWIGLSF